MTTEALLPKLDDKGIQYALKQANVIMLSIGGNDIFQGGGLMDGAADSDELELEPAKLMAALPQASERLQAILEKIRAINPDARIVYIGLYHPFPIWRICSYPEYRGLCLESFGHGDCEPGSQYDIGPYVRSVSAQAGRVSVLGPFSSERGRISGYSGSNCRGYALGMMRMSYGELENDE